MLTPSHGTRVPFIVKVIGIDVMGGDRAPRIPLLALRKVVRGRKAIPARFVLFGKKTLILRLLETLSIPASKVEVVDAPTVISPKATVREALRASDSSMSMALEALREGEVEAVLSAGNTGALLGLGLQKLGPIRRGVRPALSVDIPGGGGFDKPFLALDLGANVRVEPRHLLFFGIMGVTYMRTMYDVSCPKIALLNVGSEETKGSQGLKETIDLFRSYEERGQYKLLGFCEGDVLYQSLLGKFPLDVAVTDGFTGNVWLKSMEGTLGAIRHLLRARAKKNRFLSLLATPFLLKFSKDFKARQLINGAPLMGLRRLVVKSHGGASVPAYKNAISATLRMVENGFQDKISRSVYDIDQWIDQ